MKEGTLRKCDAVWSYQEVRRLAVLTTKEMQHFEETLARLTAMEYCEYKSVSVLSLQNLTTNAMLTLPPRCYCYLLNRPYLGDFVGVFSKKHNSASIILSNSVLGVKPTWREGIWTTSMFNAQSVQKTR